MPTTTTSTACVGSDISQPQQPCDRPSARVLFVTDDHDPSLSEAELSRVRRAGGRTLRTGGGRNGQEVRVYPGGLALASARAMMLTLNMSRALGHRVLSETAGIIPKPDITAVWVRADRPLSLVLGSDGLWSPVSVADVIEFDQALQSSAVSHAALAPLVSLLAGSPAATSSTAHAATIASPAIIGSSAAIEPLLRSTDARAGAPHGDSLMGVQDLTSATINDMRIAAPSSRLFFRDTVLRSLGVHSGSSMGDGEVAGDGGIGSSSGGGITLQQLQAVLSSRVTPAETSLLESLHVVSPVVSREPVASAPGGAAAEASPVLCVPSALVLALALVKLADYRWTASRGGDNVTAVCATLPSLK